MKHKRGYIGIDFGTSNSVISYALGGEKKPVPRQPGDYVPTAVYQDRVGKWFVGHLAIEKGLEDRKYLFNVDIKKLLREPGSKKRGRMGDVSVKYLAKLIIEQLLDNARKERGDLSDFSFVATHPVGDDWKRAIRDLYREFDLEDVTLLSEPEAALYYAQSQLKLFDDREQTVLLIDYGGGTCDFLLFKVRKKFFGIGTKLKFDQIDEDYYGSYGGTTIDSHIALKLVSNNQQLLSNLHTTEPEEYAMLIKSIKEAKEYLSQVYNPTNEFEQKTIRFPILSEGRIQIKRIPLSVAQLEEWTSEKISTMLEYVLFERSEGSKGYALPALLPRNNLKPSDISSILLTGGSSQFPWLRQKLLPSMFPHLRDGGIEIFEPAHLTVAYGASIYAHDQHCDNIRLQRYAAEPLKIIYSDGTEEILVDRGVPLPTKRSELFEMPRTASSLWVTLIVGDGRRVDDIAVASQEREFIFKSEIPEGTVMEYIVHVDEQSDVNLQLRVAGESIESQNIVSFNNLELDWDDMRYNPYVD